MKRRRRSPIRWKSIQITLATFLALGLSATGAFAYEFRKSITIDRSKISDGSCGATLANFPMLFSVTDSDLRHTSSGGDVTDLGGDDIIFVALDAMTCGGPSICRLDHEIEKYVNTTGELVAWVRLPSVNTSAAASDTIIYIYYGDGKVTSPTENPAGVWDANHAGVWHLHDDFLDSANAKRWREQRLGAPPTRRDRSRTGRVSTERATISTLGPWATSARTSWMPPTSFG